jgi:hypothetical protein
MARNIVSEVTRLGSTLAELATDQVQTVLTELRGSAGEAQKKPRPDLGPGAERINLGTLGFDVLKLASKVGELMTQLSQYDLVRAGAPTLFLRAANPITSVTLAANEALDYRLLVENAGSDEDGRDLTLIATLELVKTHGAAVGPAVTAPAVVVPASLTVAAFERRQVTVNAPALATGKWVLRIDVAGADGPLAAKTVEITVLPPPGPPRPQQPPPKDQSIETGKQRTRRKKAPNKKASKK